MASTFNFYVDVAETEVILSKEGDAGTSSEELEALRSAMAADGQPVGSGSIYAGIEDMVTFVSGYTPL
jgi:hypothetical protein